MPPWVGALLSWPDGSGMVWAVLVGAGPYIHTHLKLSRHHRERLAQSGANRGEQR